MKWKREIERAASQLMQNINRVKTPGQQLKPVAVRVVEEVKPASYYVPQMVFTSKNALNQEPEPALFCEIWVNSVCIWRKSYQNPDPEKRSWKKEDYSEEAINGLWHETLVEMSMFAIWNNYDFTTKLHEAKDRPQSVVMSNNKNENHDQK